MTLPFVHKAMKEHESLQLKNSAAPPTREALELVLGKSYAAYEALQDALPQMEIEQAWQWYMPYKAWFAKGQYAWTTPRGARKEKNVYWLHVYAGYCSVAIWFKEKNRNALLCGNLREELKQKIADAETIGKVPTFPVIFDICNSEVLADVCALLECKKHLET